MLRGRRDRGALVVFFSDLQSRVPFRGDPTRLRRLVPVAVFAAVLAVRSLYFAALEASPLSEWHLWMETDEWGYVDWSAHLASGNWLDVPAWRSYFSWQAPYGPPAAWERLYQKNAYFAGPLYPYSLAVIRIAGLPLLPTVRLLQLLLACLAAASVAAAAQGIAGRFLLRGREGEGDEKGGAAPFSGPVAAAGLVAGLFYGLYGPLVFQDGFAYRDGPVAHLSALLLAWPLLASETEEEGGGAREGFASKKGNGGGAGAFSLGLLGGLAALLKQTLLPLAFFSLFLLSKKSPVGAKRRLALGALGLAIPLMALAARNVAAGVPPLTFDTRQAIGLAWGNGRGADASTAPPRDDEGDPREGRSGRRRRPRASSSRDTPTLRGSCRSSGRRRRPRSSSPTRSPTTRTGTSSGTGSRCSPCCPSFRVSSERGSSGSSPRSRAACFERKRAGWSPSRWHTARVACLLVQTTARYRVGVVPPLALGIGLSGPSFLRGMARAAARAGRPAVSCRSHRQRPLGSSSLADRGVAISLRRHRGGRDPHREIRGPRGGGRRDPTLSRAGGRRSCPCPGGEGGRALVSGGALLHARRARGDRSPLSPVRRASSLSRTGRAESGARAAGSAAAARPRGPPGRGPRKPPPPP